MLTTVGNVRSLIREAFDKESYWEQLAPIIARYAAPHTYVRFDDRESFSKARSFRTDLNPNQHTNHLGLWVYMIEPGAKGVREYSFGASSRWVTILRAKDPSKLLRTDSYGDSDLKADIAALSKVHGKQNVLDALDRHTKHVSYMRSELETTELDDEELRAETLGDLDEQLTLPVAKLEALAKGIDRGVEIRRRYREFYLSLGYKGIEDPLGLIDTNGWTAVHFDPSNVAIVKRFKLKDAFDPEEHDKEEDEWRAKHPLPPKDFDPSDAANDPGDPAHEPGWYVTDTGERKKDPRNR
jgi:hypothetical protein